VKRSMAWIGAAVLALAVTGCGLFSAPVSTRFTPSDVEVLGATLAQGYLQKVNSAWWHKVEHLSLLDSQGHSVHLPTNRPVLFFAWWCPHCHAALRALKRDKDLSHLTFVSMYLNAMPAHGKPALIRTANDAKQITESSLASLGIHIPSDHILYLMPRSAANSTAMGVPVLVEHTRSGWYAMNGAPSDSTVWQRVLSYAQIARGRVDG